MTRPPRPAYVFGPYRLDAETGAVTYEDQPVPLPPKAVDVLLALIEEDGNVVSKEELTKRAWPDTAVEPGSLSYQIHVIRRVLRERTNGAEFIETVPKRGFRFTAPVTRSPRAGNGNGGPPGTSSLPPVVVGSPVAQSASDIQPALEPAVHLQSADQVAGQARPDQPAPEATAKRPIVARRGAAAIAVLAVVGILGLLAIPRGPAGRLAVLDARRVSSDGLTRDRTPLLVDDSRIYFRAATDSENWRLPLAGGPAAPVFDQGQYLVVDVHPTRAEYLALAQGTSDEDKPLWIVPTAAGTAQRVGAIVASDAAWSRDGSRIAHVTSRALHVSDASGTATRRLSAPAQGTPLWPRWAPDGRVLRFTLAVPGDRTPPAKSIWQIGADGTGLRQLFTGWNNPGNECCGIWTHDGEHFIFQAERDGRTDLWTVPERRRRFWSGEPEPARLTSGGLAFFGPAPHRSAPEVFATGVDDRGELVRVDPATRELQTYLGGLPGQWATRSRDGKEVAYIGYPDQQLWRARADGTGRRQLTSGVFANDAASWSPDDKWIAFRSRMKGTHLRIYLLPLSGGPPVPISDEDVEQSVPSWSPSGTHLVYGDVPAIYGQATGDEKIYIYDVANRTTEVVPGIPGEPLWAPRWSPDREHLSAETIRERAVRIFTFATKTWRALPLKRVEQANWSSDSRFITYLTEGGELKVKRVRLSDGHVEVLLDLRDHPFVPYPWVGIAPDGAPVFMRNLGTTEIYSLKLGVR